jgi:hypothetical protein
VMVMMVMVLMVTMIVTVPVVMKESMSLVCRLVFILVLFHSYN